MYLLTTFEGSRKVTLVAFFFWYVCVHVEDTGECGLLTLSFLGSKVYKVCFVFIVCDQLDSAGFGQRALI